MLTYSLSQITQMVHKDNTIHRVVTVQSSEQEMSVPFIPADYGFQMAFGFPSGMFDESYGHFEVHQVESTVNLEEFDMYNLAKQTKNATRLEFARCSSETFQESAVHSYNRRFLERLNCIEKD